MRFVIDSCSLMDLEDTYPIDVFPSIYEICEDMFNNGGLFSVKEAFNELKDSQNFWVAYKKYFKDLDDAELSNLQEIMNSEKFKVFRDWGLKENKEFWADPHLVACAMGNKDIVVVSEESSNNYPERKIPYVCSEYGIDCIKILEFFRKNNVKL